MTENMGKRPWQVAFRTQEDRKSGHRMAPEIIFFPRTGYGGMILINLKVIWDMSVKFLGELAMTGGLPHTVAEALEALRPAPGPQCRE